jgi:hypothetical protein
MSHGTPRAWHALAAYTAITLAATWPLAAGLGRDVAWDLGDSLLNMWVLSWDAEQMLAILRGDFSRSATFFDGNIFHPAPLTLAYAEHLVPQAIQILPVYAITKNPILCYNLLFLSTFILSGFGTFLFVRELTGRPVAAFVAGLLFAFAPYRWPQSPHMQVLSAQWMPFALYGFRRYFRALERGDGALRPLAGAGGALVLQNLSCGYYLLYFSPFAGAYVLWEMAQRGLMRTFGVWTQLSVAAVAVFTITLPFLLPYVALRETMQFERSSSEVIRYSADVHSYATASDAQPLWGGIISAFPKPEGDLFPGFVAILLAAIGLCAWRSAGPPVAEPAPHSATRRRWLPPLLLAGAVVHLALAMAGLVYRRIVLDVGLFELRVSNINQMLLRAALFAVALLIVSPGSRHRLRAFMADRGFFLVALIAAIWLSFGPVPQVLGRPVELAAPYAFLYEHVPGFDGVRVPARFGMVGALMLAILGGFGAAVLSRRRAGTAMLAAVSVVFLAEALVMPFKVNLVSPTRGFNTPEARVYRPARAPNVYKVFAREAREAVLAELPIGETDFDLRAIFYSTVHWRPVLNGYSGFYPPHYGRLALTLSDVPRFTDPAMQALRMYGVTHVLVHEGAYVDARGTNTSAVLLAQGATELYREGTDVLLQLP